MRIFRNKEFDRLIQHALDATVFNNRIPLKIKQSVAATALEIAKAVLGPCTGRAPKTLIIHRHWKPDARNEPSIGELEQIRKHEPKNKAFFKEQLFDKVFFYLRNNVAFRNGAWDEDWGDALNSGVPLLLKYAEMTGSQEVREMALATMEHCRFNLQKSSRRPLIMLEQAERALMSAAALMEAGKCSRSSMDAAHVQNAVDFFTKLSCVCGHIIDTPLGAALQDCYGTVTPAAMLALLNLSTHEYLMKCNGQNATHHLEKASEIMHVIEKKAWDPRRNRYVFRLDDKRDFVYPNPIMLLAHLFMYENTGEEMHLHRAHRLLEHIEQFRDPDRGGYFTPYWELWVYGKYHKRLKSLSANNYMALAFLELHRITGEITCLDRFRELYDFIERDLYHDGLIWHEWRTHTGRSTLGSYEPYCAGCNIMVLNTLMRANHDYGLGEILKKRG